MYVLIRWFYCIVYTVFKPLTNTFRCASHLDIIRPLDIFRP